MKTVFHRTVLSVVSVVILTTAGVRAYEIPKNEWKMQEEHILHSVGHARGTEEWDAQVARDVRGHLQYGPYKTDLPAGTFEAYWELMTDDNAAQKDDAPAVTVDIYDGTADKILAIQDIHRTDFKERFAYQKFTLSFDLPTSAMGHAIEARAFWHQKAYIREHRVGITPVHVALMSWSAAELSHHVGEVYGASGWSADPTKYKPGMLQYGPYTDKLAPGNYVAAFDLLVGNTEPTANSETLVNIDVYDSTAGKTLATRALTYKDWSKANVFQSFSLPFVLNKESAGHQIEMRVGWLGTVFIAEKGVRLDRTGEHE